MAFEIILKLTKITTKLLRDLKHQRNGFFFFRENYFGEDTNNKWPLTKYQMAI